MAETYGTDPEHIRELLKEIYGTDDLSWLDRYVSTSAKGTPKQSTTQTPTAAKPEPQKTEIPTTKSATKSTPTPKPAQKPAQKPSPARARLQQLRIKQAIERAARRAATRTRAGAIRGTPESKPAQQPSQQPATPGKSESGKAKTTGLTDKILSTLGSMYKSVKGKVQAHPYASIAGGALAAGLGALALKKLLSRRKKKKEE